MTTQQTISERTGFDFGDYFKNEKQVRVYFTPEVQRVLFGDDAVVDRDLLAGWAELVIARRWYCRFSDHEED